MNDLHSARRYARRRLKARNVLRVLLLVWVGVVGVTTAVWFLDGAHAAFWPVWPAVGVGIAVVAVALRGYGPRIGYISDADVDAEAARLER